MKTSFTTIACPEWDLETILKNARVFGYQSVDFRGLQEVLDVTTLVEFNENIEDTLRRIRYYGLEISGISSSIRVCDKKQHESNLAEASRTIPIAKALGCKYVRVYGGGNIDEHGKEKAAEIGRACIEKILSLEGARDLIWLFETHDNWIRSKDCKLLLDHIPDPAFGALWDIGHTSRVGEEKPEETFAAIGDRVHYIHIKDAVYEPDHPLAMTDGWRYVFPGEGDLPLAEGLALLKNEGYEGWICFEHEKRWHPVLSEPEIALPKFIEWVAPHL